MRLLWAGNYSSQSGYAIQARMFVPRLAAHHHVAVLELAPATGMAREINGINLLPVGKDPLGSDVFLDHFRRGEYHAVLTLVDVWGLAKDVMRQLPWFPLTPIDTTPPTPAVLEALKACQRPIAISRFGEAQMRSVGLDPLYLPHGFDPAVWYPRSVTEKRIARKALHVSEDAFLVTFCGVNDSLPSRKGIPELLFAWQMFQADHPDAVLYLHTEMHGNRHASPHHGTDIPTMIQTLRIPQDSIRIADGFRLRTMSFPAAELAMIASASNVLLAPSRGEGFGVPVIEFAATGCPAIVTEFSAQQELAEALCGWTVEYEPEWNWQNAMWAKPGIASIVERLEEAYADRHNLARRQATYEASRAYQIDAVMERYGQPVLNTIAADTLNWKAAQAAG